MYSVGHKNIFIILMATSFGHNGHRQVSVSRKLKKASAHNAKSIYNGSNLHYC
jgi:hypothetical protein